jgi:predicted DCC family thiol-disulfide oxidoreductase YuxK
MGETSPPIVLFDGVCNLCSGSVQFLLKRDPEGLFRFAPLQSDVGRRLLAEHGLTVDSLSSVVLIEDGKVWQESSAALRIARHLPGAWKLLRSFAVVPRPLRDAVYRWIARNRYRWFGKTETCWLPTPELEERFLG